MKKIKVCYTISSLCEGPTYIIYGILEYMDYEKFDVSIVTMIPEKDTSLIGKFKHLPVKIYQLAPQRKISPFRMALLLRNVIKKIEPDIVHVHCPRSRLLSPLLPSKCKKIETLHNNPDLPMVLYGKIKGSIVMKLSTIVTRKMDLVIPCSESVGNKYNALGITNVPIPNGTSMPIWRYDIEEKNRLKDKLRLDKKKKWFLFVGRFSEEKNPGVVISAFLKMADNRFGLIMLGNGRLWEKLKTYESDNIIMPGFTHNVQQYMKAADYFISASDSEGMPNTVLEALANGMPLLLSDIGPHAEIVNKSKSTIGYLYNQKDYISLCDALTKVVCLNTSEVSEADHVVLIENYSAQLMSERYQNEYTRLIMK